MDFDVFCDESHPDLLASEKSTAKYLLIGSLWMLKEDREQFKKDINALRENHRVGAEFKWGKVSYSKLAFYKDLVRWFWDQDDKLRFRCIVVDKQKIDFHHHHQKDQELGFYKFYYQLLRHWVADFNNYQFFCDYKTNRRRDRLHILKDRLEQANLSAQITNIQAIRAEESLLIQLVDVLTGLTSAKFNRSSSNKSGKMELIHYFEELLEHYTRPPVNLDNKCSIFQIDLKGGWG